MFHETEDTSGETHSHGGTCVGNSLAFVVTSGDICYTIGDTNSSTITSTHSPSRQKIKPYTPTLSSYYCKHELHNHGGFSYGWQTSTHSFFIRSGLVATADIALRNQQSPSRPESDESLKENSSGEEKSAPWIMSVALTSTWDQPTILSGFWRSKLPST